MSKITLPGDRRARARVSIITLILLVLSFLLGVAVSAFLFNRSPERALVKAENQNQPQTNLELSGSTKAILNRINSPIEIRLYSLLDPTTVDAATMRFADRAKQLLSAYQQAAQGKLTVNQYTTQSYSAANAATTDGIKAFNTEHGEPCFLGLAVIRGGQKETLPRLPAEWEPVLEADLSRAIQRVLDSSAGQATLAMKSQLDPAVVDAVKRNVPNYDSLSLEDGIRILREAALKQFKASVADQQNELQKAQQELSRAQNGGTEAEPQAAMKHLQQVQSAQTEQLKKIAADSQAQLEALRQLKASKP